MKKFISIFLFLTIFSTLSLFAEEKIGGTLNNTDLIIKELVNKEGHNYGERYYILNRNKYPVQVSIKITNSHNVDDYLVPYTVIVKEFQRIEVGEVYQTEITKKSSWDYEWQVQPD